MAAPELTFDFPPLTPAAWRDRLEKELPAGQSYDALRWHPPGEDYRLEPFYTAEDVAPLPYPAANALVRAHKPTTNGWRTMAALPATADARATGQAAAEALASGYDGVELDLTTAAGFSVDELAGTFGHTPPYLGFRLADEAAVAGFLPQLAQLPAGATGYLHVTRPDFALPHPDVVRALAGGRPGYGFAPLTADGAALADAGAGHTLQLALVLSQAAQLLDELTDQAIAPEQAGDWLRLAWGLSTSFFHDLAALRALRLLWFNLLAGYDVAPDQVITPTVHARPAARIVYGPDPHTNLLRLTTAAMSAVLGGCDLLTITAFDAHTPGGATPFGERQARNLALLLREEARLDQVADPAAGAYYLEKLTDELARGAWAVFQELEALGGYRAAQADGLVAHRVAEQHQLFAEREASGQQVRIGVNKYQPKA